MTWWTLTALAFKGSLVALCALAATWMLRRSSAAVRYTALLSGIVGLALLPGWVWICEELAGALGVGAVALPLPAGLTSLTVTPETGMDWAWAITAIWGLVCGMLLLRLAAAHWWVYGIGRSARLAGAIEETEIRISDRIDVPLTFGLFRPVILLPATAGEWAEERRRVVLLHEQAHVKRRDGLARLLGQVACAMHWFNPLAWTAASRMHAEQEKACDDQVLRQGVNPADYAEHLLEIARNLSRKAPSPAAAMAMANASELQPRLQSILTRGRHRGPLTRLQIFVAAGFTLALVSGIAAVRADLPGVLSGVLSDGMGVVPGASVEVRGAAGVVRRAQTNEVGEYRFDGLPPGKYDVRIRAQGFREGRLTAQNVRAGEELRRLSRLELGMIRERVNVMGTAEPRRIRVGGNRQAMKLIEQPKPRYPEEARTAGIQGTVRFRAIVDPQGGIRELTLVSSPSPLLTDAAGRAVRQWRYESTWLNGQPVEVETMIDVNFQLLP